MDIYSNANRTRWLRLMCELESEGDRVQDEPVAEPSDDLDDRRHESPESYHGVSGLFRGSHK